LGPKVGSVMRIKSKQGSPRGIWGWITSFQGEQIQKKILTRYFAFSAFAVEKVLFIMPLQQCYLVIFILNIRRGSHTFMF